MGDTHLLRDARLITVVVVVTAVVVITAAVIVSTEHDDRLAERDVGRRLAYRYQVVARGSRPVLGRAVPRSHRVVWRLRINADRDTLFFARLEPNLFESDQTLRRFPRRQWQRQIDLGHLCTSAPAHGLPL